MKKVNVIIGASLLVGASAFTIYAVDAVDSVTKTDTRHTITTVDGAGNVVTKTTYDTESTSVTTKPDTTSVFNDASHRALLETREDVALKDNPLAEMLGRNCIRQFRTQAKNAKNDITSHSVDYAVLRCKEDFEVFSVEDVKAVLPSLADY